MGCQGATGECVCESGWTGAVCDTGMQFYLDDLTWSVDIYLIFLSVACPSGVYGPGCYNECRCANGAACDRFDGSCSCTRGYTGRYCTQGLNCWKCVV